MKDSNTRPGIGATHGVSGSSGGAALREYLLRCHAPGVMTLLKNLSSQGMAAALAEVGFTVKADLVTQGRTAVYQSVKKDLERVLSAGSPEKAQQLMDAMSMGRSGDTPGQGEAGSLQTAGRVSQRLTAAALIDSVFRSDRIQVSVLGEAPSVGRDSLLMVAGQGLQKGIQGFGFEGLPGKYQVPLSMQQVVDLHAEAAKAVAVDSATRGLVSWAAGEKATDLSDWVPDSVQRLLHSAVNLQTAEVLAYSVQGSTIKAHAAEIGRHTVTGLLAKQGLDVNAPTVKDQASSLNLTVKEPNRDRGQYFGTVVGVDHRACLIKFTRTEALEVAFADLGDNKPGLGKSVRLGFKDGAMSVQQTAAHGMESISR